VLDWASESSEGTVPAHLLFVKPYSSRSTYEALVCQVQPRVVVLIHWDDFLRPLSKPLGPTLGPPKWAVPPFRRVDPDHVRQTIEQLSPQTAVLVPEMFRAYDALAPPGEPRLM
jgi:hypothetical protein